MRQLETGNPLRLPPKRWSALLLVPGLTACEAVNDTLIGANAPIWMVLSLFAAMLPGGLAMFVVFLRRFRSHDLGSGGKSPSAFSLPGVLLCATLGLVALVFTFYNWFADVGIPPGQQWSNIFAWWLGAALGGGAAYLGGRELAFRQYDRMAAAEHGATRSTRTEDR